MKEKISRLDQKLSSAGGPLSRVSIPAEMVADFTHRTALQRRQALLVWTIVWIVMYCAFGIADRALLPDIFWLAWLFRFAVILPLGLTLLYLLRYTRCPLVAMQWLVMGAAWLSAVMMGALAVFSDSIDALGYLIANYALLSYTIIMAALPRRLVALFSLGVVTVQTIAVALGPLQAPMLQMHNLFSAIILVMPSLFAHWLLENERRRYFLLLTREESYHQLLAEQRDLLGQLAALDPLTELANRRGFDAAVASVMNRRGDASALALAMIDIDYFKPYNDRYGHPTGDQTLRAVARVLKTATQPSGHAARLGGEEFVVVWPGVNSLAELESRAERIRGGIQALAIAHHDSRIANVVTVSIGAALGHVPDKDVTSLSKIADDALYRAKQAGRNRVVVIEVGHNV